MRKSLTTIAVVALLLTLAGGSVAEDLSDRTMVGGRAGVWVNTGDEGPLLIPTSLITTVEQDINDAGLYAELIYSHGFSSLLRFDFSLGITTRTDLVSNAQDIFGSVNMYPIQFALRLYPLGSVSLGNLHPYALGGAALTIASQSRQGVGSFFGDSRTKASVDFLLGGGVDIPVAAQIALNFSGKYHHIDFGEDSFNNVRDFSGFSATFGIVYMKR